MMETNPAMEKGVGPLDHLPSAHPEDELESICSELEQVELTEEETTSLLNDALELNKRLKEELRRQEWEEREIRDGMRTRTGAGSTRSACGGVGRRGNAVSTSLPPIHPQRGLSLNQRRIYNSTEAGGHHSKMKKGKPVDGMQRKAHSADGGQRPTSSSSSSSGKSRPRGTQSAESKQRPGWNDRFSY